MNKSAIQDIYFGNRDVQTFKTSKEYWKMSNQVSKLSKKLEETLNDEQNEILKEITLLSLGLEAELAFNHFSKGFKFGLQLGVESLIDLE